jgi:hypothetical protein
MQFKNEVNDKDVKITFNQWLGIIAVVLLALLSDCI